MKACLLVFLTFVAFSFNWMTNFYDPKWPLFFFFSSFYAFGEFALLERIIISYCLGSFGYIGLSGLNHYEVLYHPNARFYIESLQGCLHFMCGIFMIKAFTKYHSWTWFIQNMLRWFFYANCIFMIVSTLCGWSCYGIDGAKSPNGTLIALTIPIIGVGWLPILFGLAAVLVSKTTMGIIGILAIGGYYTLVQLKKTKTALISSGLVALAVVGVAYYFYGGELFSFNGRIEAWSLARGYWTKNWATMIFGSGGGTFSYIMPALQHSVKFDKFGYFIFLHSDILQVAFEFGLIGLFLFGAFFTTIIYRLHMKQNFQLACFFVVLLVSCFGNFPFRLGPDVFLICFAIANYLVLENRIEQSTQRIRSEKLPEENHRVHPWDHDIGLHSWDARSLLFKDAVSRSEN